MTEDVPQADSSLCVGPKLSCDSGMPAEKLAMSEGQCAAMHAANKEPVFILTGGPGSGKTLTTAHIVKMWRSCSLKVAVAAPTGEHCVMLMVAIRAMMGKPVSSTLRTACQAWTGLGVRGGVASP